MAVYFQLSVIGVPTEMAATFTDVDDEIRRHFKAPPSTTHWYLNWYNEVGFALALGKSWDECLELFPEQAPVIEYLRHRYVVTCWNGR